MFVPIVQVSVEPIQNGDRPSIEKSHRLTRCPVYQVNLIKERWKSKGRPMALVNVSKITDKDDLWSVPAQPGLSAAAGEEMRLRQQYGQKIFESVFRGSEFEDQFNACAVEVNPHEIDREERAEQIRQDTVKRAAKGIMDAAGDAAVQGERARNKGGRPPGSKNKVHEPADA